MLGPSQSSSKTTSAAARLRQQKQQHQAGSTGARPLHPHYAAQTISRAANLHHIKLLPQAPNATLISPSAASSGAHLNHQQQQQLQQLQQPQYYYHYEQPTNGGVLLSPSLSATMSPQERASMMSNMMMPPMSLRPYGAAAERPASASFMPLDKQALLNRPLCRCRVMYLGSSVPHITKNGLHGIQEPLKHLYPEEQFSGSLGVGSGSGKPAAEPPTNGQMQSTTGHGPNDTTSGGALDAAAAAATTTIDISHLSSGLGIDSWLSVWSNGLLLENVDEFGREIKRFFSIESLHYCAAVRFFDACKLEEQRQHDTTTAAAANDHYDDDPNNNTIGRPPAKGVESNGAGAGARHHRKSVARFLPLDAPIFQCAGMMDANHPPVFAAIMRRTTGIKVLECHAFICRRDAAANALVRCCTHAYRDFSSAKRLSLELGVGGGGVGGSLQTRNDYVASRNTIASGRQHRRAISLSAARRLPHHHRAHSPPSGAHIIGCGTAGSGANGMRAHASDNNNNSSSSNKDKGSSTATLTNEDNSLEASSEDNYAIIPRHHHHQQQQQQQQQHYQAATAQPRVACPSGALNTSGNELRADEPDDQHDEQRDAAPAARTNGFSRQRDQAAAAGDIERRDSNDGRRQLRQSGGGKSKASGRSGSGSCGRRARKTGSSRSLFDDFMPRTTTAPTATASNGNTEMDKLSHSMELFELRARGEGSGGGGGSDSLATAADDQYSAIIGKDSRRHSRSMQNLDKGALNGFIGVGQSSASSSSASLSRRHRAARRSGQQQQQQKRQRSSRQQPSQTICADGGCARAHRKAASFQDMTGLSRSSARSSVSSSVHAAASGNNVTGAAPDSLMSSSSSFGSQHQIKVDEPINFYTHTDGAGNPSATCNGAASDAIGHIGAPDQDGCHPLTNGAPPVCCQEGATIGSAAAQSAGSSTRSSRKSSTGQMARRARDTSRSRRRDLSAGRGAGGAPAVSSSHHHHHQRQPLNQQQQQQHTFVDGGQLMAAYGGQPVQPPQLPLPMAQLNGYIHHSPYNQQQHHHHQSTTFKGAPLMYPAPPSQHLAPGPMYVPCCMPPPPPGGGHYGQPLFRVPPGGATGYEPGALAHYLAANGASPGLHYNYYGAGLASPVPGSMLAPPELSLGGGGGKSSSKQAGGAKAGSKSTLARFRCLSPPMNFLTLTSSTSASSRQRRQVALTAATAEIEAPSSAANQASAAGSESGNPDRPTNSVTNNNNNSDSTQTNGRDEMVVSAEPGFISNSAAGARPARQPKRMGWIKRLSLTMAASGGGGGASSNAPSPMPEMDPRRANEGGRLLPAAAAMATPNSGTPACNSADDAPETRKRRSGGFFSGSLTLGRSISKQQQRRQQQQQQQAKIIAST